MTKINIRIQRPPQVSILLQQRNEPFKLIRATSISPTDRTGRIEDEIAETEAVVTTLQAQVRRLTPFELTFTQANLSIDNILPVLHGFPSSPGQVTVWNDAGDEVGPDDIAFLGAPTFAIAVDLGSFVPLQGNYTIRVSL